MTFPSRAWDGLTDYMVTVWALINHYTGAGLSTVVDR